MAYWVCKVILSPVLVLLWRVRVEGREHVPHRGPAVLAANHQSFCDSLFIPLVLRRRVTFLAKAEYFTSWRTAWFFRAVGQIPVRRGGGPASERALQTAAEVLASGRLLAVYPEGTRSRDGRVHRGRTGVGRLALELGVPIVPVGIEGTEAVQPIGSRLMRPFRPVTVRFGPPIVPGDGPLVVPGDGAPVLAGAGVPGEAGPEADHLRCRAVTDRVMRSVAELAGRVYEDSDIAPPVR